MISAGAYHSACLTEGGEVYVWGLNDYGQLGNNGKNNMEAPYRVKGAIQEKCVVQVVCGGRHTIATTAFKPIISVMESSYLADFKSLFTSNTLSDIKLLVEDKNIQSHKIILSRCTKFKEMFRNQQIHEFVVKDVIYPIFMCLLEYLYTDNLDIPNLDKKAEEAFVVELLSAARTYGARTLIENLEYRVNLGPDWKSACPKLPELLSYDLAEMVNNSFLSDIEFDVEGQMFKGHKVIMATRSPHFRALFLDSFKEAEDKIIPFEMHSNSFKTLLDYMYSDTVDIPEDEAVEVMTTANEFNLDRLKTICEEFIAQGVDCENVSWLFEICDRIEATQLKAFCFYFLRKEFDTVSKTEAFKSLSPDVLQEVTKLKSSNDKGKKDKKTGEAGNNCTIQ